MNILCIGDVVSRTGREMLFSYLPELQQQKQIDFIIANGENATHGRGLARPAYDELMQAGVDAITLGNHTWGAKDVVHLMQYEDNIIRPANFDRGCPGRGSMVLKASNGVRVGILNLIGRTYMNPCASPFEVADSEIAALREKSDVLLVDFHAEATSEKIAMGWYLDGKVSAVFGTHTHVQTSDETVLPKGSGYITDLGMTGPSHSVLGMERKIILDRFLTGMPQKFEIASGKGQFSGCIFTIDTNSGHTTAVERIFYKE